MLEVLNGKENSHGDLEYPAAAQIGEVEMDKRLRVKWADLPITRLTGRGRLRVRVITDKYEVRGSKVRTRDHAAGDADYWRGGANRMGEMFNRGPIVLDGIEASQNDGAPLSVFYTGDGPHKPLIEDLVPPSILNQLPR